MDGIILEIRGVPTPIGWSDLETWGTRWFGTSTRIKIGHDDRALAMAVIKRAYDDGVLKYLPWQDTFTRVRIEHKLLMERHRDVFVIAINHCLMSLKPFEELEDPV